MTKKPIVFPEIDASGEVKPFLNLTWPTLYADLQKTRKEEWIRVAERYEAAPDDLHVVWHWLNAHPIFYYFSNEKKRHESSLCSERGIHEGLELIPALVDKDTRQTGGPPENAEIEIWVEAFPASITRGSNDIRLHDYEVDTGAPTYEEALIKVAGLIYERHGHDRVRLTELWDGA